MVKKIIPFKVAIKSTAPVRNFERPKVYTNDLNSVEFQFTVTDCTDAELTNSTATTMLYMTDKSFFQNPTTDVDRVANVYSYTLKENEGNHGGLAEIQLVIIIDGVEFASQLYEFEIINGLETKVAQEVMIYDWTTLTRDARAYIDQFVADELLRDAEFDNNEFDRNAAFVSSQDARTLAFGTEQTNRGTAFTDEQNERTAAFNESESGRTTAENGRVTAEDGRVEAETDRVTEEGKRVTAESGRVTEEGKRVTAESGRVTAETNRAAAFTTFNTRLTAEETATAANKISAVKGKTFADVDARFEDVEFDTTMMGTNLITNGDFSNGTTDWSLAGTGTVTNKELIFTNLASSSTEVTRNVATVIGNRYYVGVRMQSNSNQDGMWFVNAAAPVSSDKKTHSGGNLYETLSAIVLATASSYSFRILDTIRSGDITVNPVKLQYAIVIDLTATFGKGNEPTVEQMDAIMAKFPNSWFNGTANLFRANATLNKLMAVDARTEFDAKNEAANGDFSNGVTGWVGVASAVSVAVGSNALTVTTDGTATYAYANQSTGKQVIQNNKYYIRGLCKAQSQFLAMALILRGYVGGDFGTSSVVNPVIGTEYPISAIFTPTTQSAELMIRMRTQQDVPSSGAIATLRYVSVLNLTQIFGAGKEPTLSEMDRLMARFPNSWFEGVKPIQTIETLYQEKANKVQEAWITPTLLNGVTHYSNPLRYRKNEFGVVEFKGGVVLPAGFAAYTNMFSMPIGYRPPNSTRFSLPLGTSAAVLDMQEIATQTLVSTTGNLIFDGVRYAAI